ncbi:MAG TPA: phage major capsid protein [Jatrophihabitans sp.]|nr:phage major capsid protein [Jatrophihabitans sp.]
MTNAAVQEAKNGMRRLALKAQETVDNTTMTQAEKKVELDKLEVDLKAFSDTIANWEAAERIIKGGDLADVATGAAAEDQAIAIAKGIGRQVTDSDAYKSAAADLAERKRVGFQVELKTPGVIDEGTATANGFLTGAAGAAVIPNFLPGVVGLRFRTLAIADLFAQGSTTSPLISYLKETAFNNSAAGVAEKGKKPLSDNTFARVAEQVGKIAHIWKITDEMMQDAAQLASYIENRMVFGLRLKEDSELLYAAGYPSVTGLMTLAASFQPNINAAGTDANGGATEVIDAVYKQITAVRYNAFVEPDGVLLDPLNWQHVQLGKDANGQYYAGGPFMGQYGNGQYENVYNFWGKKAVVTPAVNDGKITVGGFQECGQVFRRTGITVEMTNSNVDDFENNLLTGRTEMREALVVYRENGFGQVTPTWT